MGPPLVRQRVDAATPLVSPRPGTRCETTKTTQKTLFFITHATPSLFLTVFCCDCRRHALTQHQLEPAAASLRPPEQCHTLHPQLHLRLGGLQQQQRAHFRGVSVSGYRPPSPPLPSPPLPPPFVLRCAYGGRDAHSDHATRGPNPYPPPIILHAPHPAPLPTPTAIPHRRAW